jgi:hypothetical protein
MRLILIINSFGPQCTTPIDIEIFTDKVKSNYQSLRNEKSYRVYD